MKTLIAAIVAVSFSLSAWAHEPRDVVGGQYEIEVGFRIEPAHEDSDNRFDFFVFRADGSPVSVRGGDQLDVNVTVLFLSEDRFDAPVLAAKNLGNRLRQDFVNPARYNIDFVPTVSGAYGFHLVGTIEGNPIDERFVCEGGSLAGSRAFDCVSFPVTFPLGPNSRYRKNR